jgi:hypothetical protein
MWRVVRNRSVRPSQTDGQAAPSSLRDRVAKLLALVTLVCVGVAFIVSKGTQLLMPGPLASAHGAIKNCSACHTQSGSGKLSWIHGLVPGDPLADSKACLTCHKMPDTAFNAHGASADALKQSTARLMKIVAGSPAPMSARAQSIAFPTGEMVARGLPCATCHQEHQGVNFRLNKISNEQCRSCHVVKFDSFDGHHPKFDNYPFKRRTPIIYDHAAHFGKHFPEVAKKEPARRIPATCSICHSTRDDKRIMAVAPFEQTCSGCHLDQITGKERASGPKGIAFLTLPGLDLQSLKEKKASIGEWPDASEAALTPFMKVMISRNARGRALIKTVGSLNLQDLTHANDSQIKAVTNLVWEIKSLFQAMIAGKASDVLGNLNIAGGAKLSANLVTDLTASIPRDVLISAQQQWLPNLATEMANRRVTGDQENSSWITMTTDSNSAGSASPVAISDPRKSAPTVSAQSNGRAAEREEADEKSDPANVKSNAEDETPTTGETNTSEKDTSQANKLDPPVCAVRVLGQCLLGGETGNASPKPDGGKATSAAQELPPAMRAGLKSLAQADKPEGAAGKSDAPRVKPDGNKATLSADNPQAKAADQSDDLLSPTEQELREIKARNKGIERPAEPEVSKAAANASVDAPANAAANPQTRTAPVISIDSDVDPVSWAEYGGWYRQDYGIFYRPTGHEDKFIYSWLFLTGPRAPKGDASPSAAVFDFLTSKDAQGSCTKCHSVDEIRGKARLVNFSQPSGETKRGSFTTFAHEPHFNITENRGCLTCHNLEKGRPYLKSYEQGDPHIFASNFGGVKKDTCQGCHQSSMARQDCLLCHKYHVNGVIAPIMTTKVPMQ